MSDYQMILADIPDFRKSFTKQSLNERILIPEV